MKVYEADVFSRIGAELGEGPLADVELGGGIFCVDIYGNQVIGIKADGEVHSRMMFQENVGTVGLTNDLNYLVVATAKGVKIVSRDGADRRTLVSGIEPGLNTRFNDGKPGPDGKLYVGSMDRDATNPICALYRIDAEGVVERLVSDVIISNGIDWLDEKTFLYIDSPRKTVRRFSLNGNGMATEKATVFSLPDTVKAVCDGDPVVPDGMCLDQHGRMWIAVYGGGCVLCVTQDGKIEFALHLPVPKPTSCCFAGANFDNLIITTTTEGMTDEQIAQYPESGNVFVANVGVHGHAPYRFQL